MIKKNYKQIMQVTGAFFAMERVEPGTLCKYATAGNCITN